MTVLQYVMYEMTKADGDYVKVQDNHVSKIVNEFEDGCVKIYRVGAIVRIDVNAK